MIASRAASTRALGFGISILSPSLGRKVAAAFATGKLPPGPCHIPMNLLARLEANFTALDTAALLLLGLC